MARATTSIIHDLLGQDTNVVHCVLDKAPVETHELSSGDTFFKYIEGGIKNLVIGAQGEAVKAGGKCGGIT